MCVSRSYWSRIENIFHKQNWTTFIRFRRGSSRKDMIIIQYYTNRVQKKYVFQLFYYM